ncbi:hypothetical protein C2G38_2139898 [Gigaspora rosea]|uniref:D-arabinono-1,4-lactone oxidase n=1 Tax=Gigaspora rosea TaxID=44941 RepID=A0A397VKW5_9GLOM|nr:hypothetical protein C2G38_2139898 [Gigaspora rosea]
MIMKHILSFLLILLISIIYKSVEENNNKGVFIRSAIPIKNKTWTSYNGAVHLSPDAIFEPTTLEELIDIVNLARINNKTIRCAGEGHTGSSLSVTKDYLVVVKKLNKVTVQKHFKHGWTAIAEAGASFGDLENALRNHDPPLTIDSAPIYDTFRVAGVVATGSHGARTYTGITSNQLCSMKIVTGSGKVYEFSEEINKLEFNAAKVNLGLLGIMYSLTFRVQPMYNLRLSDIFVPLNWLDNPLNIKNLLESSDSVQLYYWPYNGFDQDEDPNLHDFNKDRIVVKNWIRTNDTATYTKQQLKKIHETQQQKSIKLYEQIYYNFSNTVATSNVAAKILSSNKNTSVVYQTPDAIHHFVYEENVSKYDLVAFGFKVDPDFSNVAVEFSYAIKALYEFAKKGKFPVNYIAEIRFLKSNEAFLSPTFNHDPKALYCLLDFITVTGTPDYEEFCSFLSQRLFDKYKAKMHWGKRYEFIPNVTSYLSEVLSDEIKQFEKVRAKYDPDKIFFDNKSLEDIFNRALNGKK